MERLENQEFFLEVMNYFNNDIEEIKFKIIPSVCQFIALYPKSQHTELLNNLIKT